MRRLLALTFVAASFAAVAPAHAAYTCRGVGSVGACVQVGYCSDLCFIDPGAYTYCNAAPAPYPGTVACAALNKVRVGKG